MADQKKYKMVPFLTIPLTLKYAWLSKPDDKFKKYSVNALGDQTDPKVAEFFKKLEAEVKKIIAEELQALPEAKRKHIESQWQFAVPFGPELNAEYQPTGLTVLKARSNADHKPTVLTNVGGKLCPTERPVYSGSIGQLKILLNPYFDGAKQKYGCSALLSKVNVTKWAERGDSGGAEAGFELGEEAPGMAPTDSGTDTPPPGSNPGDF